jgi:hypothetical protein
MGMNVIVVSGGRNYEDRDFLFAALDHAHAKKPISLLIQGGCKSGADLLAKRWCLDRGVHCAQIDALWDFFGNSAGPKRNRAMFLLKPDGLIAFDGGNGTADAVACAEACHVPVWKPGS